VDGLRLISPHKEGKARQICEEILYLLILYSLFILQPKLDYSQGHFTKLSVKWVKLVELCLFLKYPYEMSSLSTSKNFLHCFVQWICLSKVQLPVKNWARHSTDQIMIILLCHSPLRLVLGGGWFHSIMWPHQLRFWVEVGQWQLIKKHSRTQL
jgi:hypothetical protein